MLPIAVLQNDKSVPPGLLIESLEVRRAPYSLIEVFRDAPLPDLREVAGVVILGGHMGAYEEQDYPFLAEEKNLVRVAVQRGLPLLGICLGCQIIADALGGSAYRVEPQEAGLVDLELTSAGRRDAVGRAITGPMVAWHHDSWDLPPGGALLATSDQYPQVFRAGSAIGVQYHPETTPEILAGWLERDGASLEEIGMDPGRFLTATLANQSHLRKRAGALFSAWISEVETAA